MLLLVGALGIEDGAADFAVLILRTLIQEPAPLDQRVQLLKRQVPEFSGRNAEIDPAEAPQLQPVDFLRLF